MTNANQKQGFTLIELLVVIAIIGILAATVLAALGSARSSGNDASLKSSLSSFKAQSELYTTTSGALGYDGACAAAATLRNGVDAQVVGTVVTDVDRATAQAVAGAVCNDTVTGWAYAAPLNVTATGVVYFCADSTGYSGSQSAGLAAAVSGVVDTACN